MTALRDQWQAPVRIARVTVCAMAAWTCVAMAQTPAPAVQKPAEKAAEKPADLRPPLPADAHVDQTIQLDGRPLKYTATVGTLPLYAGDGKKSADVVFTSYVFEFVELCRKRRADCSPSGLLAYRVAICEYRKFVELAERALESWEGVIYLLQIDILHPKIDDHRSRNRKRAGGEVVQLLLLPVFQNAKVIRS